MSTHTHDTYHMHKSLTTCTNSLLQKLRVCMHTHNTRMHTHTKAYIHIHKYTYMRSTRARRCSWRKDYNTHTYIPVMTYVNTHACIHIDIHTRTYLPNGEAWSLATSVGMQTTDPCSEGGEQMQELASSEPPPSVYMYVCMCVCMYVCM